MHNNFRSYLDQLQQLSWFESSCQLPKMSNILWAGNKRRHKGLLEKAFSDSSPNMLVFLTHVKQDISASGNVVMIWFWCDWFMRRRCCSSLHRWPTHLYFKGARLPFTASPPHLSSVAQSSEVVNNTDLTSPHPSKTLFKIPPLPAIFIWSPWVSVVVFILCRPCLPLI